MEYIHLCVFLHHPEYIGMKEAVSAIEYVTRSIHRVRVLEQLRSGERTRGELEASIDASSRTIRRVTDGLSEAGWVEQTTAGFALTPTGTVFAEEFAETLSKTETLLKLQPFFRWFPRDVCSLSPEAFEDATVTVRKPHSPYEPVDRALNRVSGTDTIRTIAPINAPFYNETYYKAIMEDSASAVTVLSEEVLSMLQRDGDALEDVMQTGRVEIYVYPDPISFGLLITDEVVAIGAYDDDGTMQALVESADETIRQWAIDTFEKYRKAATEIESA